MVAWASTGGIGIADGPLRGKGIRQGLESGLEGPKRDPRGRKYRGDPLPLVPSKRAGAHRDDLLVRRTLVVEPVSD